MSKALGYKILVANTISLFLFFTIFSAANLEYSAQIPGNINNVPEYNPKSFEIKNWKPPTTGVQEIDWLLAFYFIFSYAVAVWLIANPLGN